MHPHPRNHPRYLACLLLASGFVPSATSAQTATQKEEPIVLPSFNVSSDLDESRKSRMATSTTRIATDLLDVPQSVSIVGPEMISATFALRAVDAIKFVAGVTDSTLPNNVDRTQIRGFQGERAIRDGFEEAFLPGNLPMFSTDHIEIVKGPNPVISPAGPPGGTINRVSKRPSFKPATTLSVAFGEYESKINAMADTTGRIAGSKEWAYRAIAGYARGNGHYSARNKVASQGLYPSVAYRATTGSTLTLIGHFEQSEGISNPGQFPLDPRVDDTTTLSRSSIYPGYRLSFPEQKPDAVAFNYPHGHKYGVTAEFETVIGSYVSTQLRARIMDTTFSEGAGVGLAGINLTGGGAYNPLTGRYTPGFTYGASAPFAATAMSLFPNTTATAFANGNSADHHDKIQLNLRDDWAVKYGSADGLWTSTSLAGVGVDRTRLFFETRLLTRTPLAAPVDILTFPDFSKLGSLVVGPVNDHRDVLRVETSAYVSETLALFQNRLQLNGGLTYYSTDDSRTDSNLINPSRTDWLSSRTVRHPTSLGVILKPIKDVSVFFGRNGNVSANDMRNTGFTNPQAFISEGVQKEYGVKASLFQGRLFTTLTNYEVRATNVQVPNSARIDNPDPALPAFVFTDRVSKGWEFDLAGKVYEGVNLRGTYTRTDIKNAFGQPVRNVAKDVFTMMARYKTPVKGLETWISGDHLSRRGGDNPQDGFTAASTKANVIIYQPRFYIPPRTLANLGASYSQDKWSVDLYISNVTDKWYVAGALTRTALYLGNPRALNTRFTYKF